MNLGKLPKSIIVHIGKFVDLTNMVVLNKRFHSILTPINLARRDLKNIHLLIAGGITGVRDKTRLFQMAAIQYPHMLEEYISIDHDDLFMIVCNHNMLRYVDMFLKCGIDPNIHGGIELERAAKHGHFSLVKMLVRAGANISLRKHLPMRMAAAHGHYDILMYLNKLGSPIWVVRDYALRHACKHNNVALVKFLLKHGADPSSSNYEALFNAATHSHLEIVKLLVLNGCDKSFIFKMQFNKVFQVGSLEVINYYIEKGARLNSLLDKSIRWAAVYGNCDAISLILPRLKPELINHIYSLAFSGDFFDIIILYVTTLPSFI